MSQDIATEVCPLERSINRQQLGTWLVPILSQWTRQLPQYGWGGDDQGHSDRSLQSTAQVADSAGEHQHHAQKRYPLAPRASAPRVANSVTTGAPHLLTWLPGPKTPDGSRR